MENYLINLSRIYLGGAEIAKLKK